MSQSLWAWLTHNYDLIVAQTAIAGAASFVMKEAVKAGFKRQQKLLESRLKEDLDARTARLKADLDVIAARVKAIDQTRIAEKVKAAKRIHEKVNTTSGELHSAIENWSHFSESGTLDLLEDLQRALTGERLFVSNDVFRAMMKIVESWSDEARRFALLRRSAQPSNSELELESGRICDVIRDDSERLCGLLQKEIDKMAGDQGDMTDLALARH